MGHAASAYIDNIYVNKDVMPMTCVRGHLAQFGLECKNLEWLEDGAQMLGLAVGMECSKLQWKKERMVPKVTDILSSIMKGWDDEARDTLFQHDVQERGFSTVG